MFQGQIVDAQNNAPIAFVSIQIKNTAIGTATDAQGNFVFRDICLSEFDVLVSHIGYKSVTHHHDAFHEDMTIVKLAPDNVMLESIVIEEEAVEEGFNSSALQTIEAKELDQVRNQSLGDMLTSITGTSVLKTGANVSKPIIHGLHSNRILIINNGVRHESQEWGLEHAPEIDPSLAEKVTVIKGAAAVKYGPNALGGVVVIDPPDLELSSHLHGDMTMRAESNGRALDGDVLLKKGHENIAWMVQGAYRKQGDLSAPDYLLTNTGMEEYTTAIGLRYHKKAWDFSMYYNRLNQTLGILRSSVAGNLTDLANALEATEPSFIRDFSYEIGTPRQEVSHDLLKLSGSYYFNTSKINWKYGAQLNRRQEFDVRRGTNNARPSLNLELTTHTFDVEWLHTNWRKWEGSVGAQWLYQDNNNIPGTNTIPFVPNYNTARLGLFLVETKKIGASTIDLGVRYDYQKGSFRGRDNNNDIYNNELSFNSVSTMLGWVRAYDHASIRINLATAWRPPNVGEMYSFGKRLFTNEYGFYAYELENGKVTTSRILSADELQINNENGYKLIVDYSYEKKQWQVTCSPYVNYVQNYIYQAPFGIVSTVRGPLPGFIYKQSDAIFAGMDATIKVNHADRWSSKIAVSYLYSRDMENNDVLFGIPSNRLTYQLQWVKPLNKLSLVNRLQVSHVLEQSDAPGVISPNTFINDPDFNPFVENDNNFDFIPPPNSYTLLDVTTSVESKRWVATVAVRNLLNIAYREYTNLMRYFADAPGINLEVKVQIKF